MKDKITPILIGALIIFAFVSGALWTRVKNLDQKTENQGEEEQTPEQQKQELEEPQVLGEQLESIIGSFKVTEDEVCKEDGKPIIYYFGSSECPHCTWEHPVLEKTTTKFASYISLHDNMDKQGVDMDIFQKYRQINQGGIPFLVFGCRYVRVGSGERVGEIEEERNLTAIICKLTNGQPENLCAEVKDLVEEIKD